MNGLKGKNVLVTGGTSGIGQAIAVRFAREGCNVAINYRSSLEEAEKTHAMFHDYEGENGIGPGATVTPINRAWIDDPEKRALVESYIPMGRAWTSEEMAGGAACLASDDAA